MVKGSFSHSKAGGKRFVVEAPGKVRVIEGAGIMPRQSKQIFSTPNAKSDFVP